MMTARLSLTRAAPFLLQLHMITAARSAGFLVFARIGQRFGSISDGMVFY